MFALDLVSWYQHHLRHLPWRQTNDPYLIWISEIMLQQTQVDTVIPYYLKFIERFNNVEALANANIEEVYKYWEGLGYYSRARNLQYAAKQIVNDYHGKFPTNAKELINLKGIGPYTSCAISSIAFLEPVSAIDGNALRIISRTHLLHDNIALNTTFQKIKNIGDSLIQEVNPSDFNQAMMDLGATICKPKKPQCEICPIQKHCLAYQNQQQDILPINIKKRYNKDIHYITGIITYQDQIMLIKNEKGLLSNLYSCIQYEVDDPYEFIEQFKKQFNQQLTLISKVKDIKHIFTHRTWYMHVYHFELKTKNPHLYTKKKIDELPISTAHLKVLKTI